MAYSKPYTKLNFVSFTFACFCTISFVVFMSSTQSFFLTDVLGISTKIGDYIGTLGFADELVSMAISPFLGALSDKIGAKYISVVGVFIVGLCLIIYTTAKNVYPDLLFMRMLFAVGATASASMMTAMLAEMTASGFELSSLLTRAPVSETIEEEGDGAVAQETSPKRNGKLASVIGIASGSGAVFAASFYLPLPHKFGQVEPPSEALKHSYHVIGCIAIASSAVLAYGLYCPKNVRFNLLSRYLSPYDEVFDELEAEEQHSENEEKSYFNLLKLGFAEAKNKKIALAYLGGFVSRSTTVCISVFIPLYVNSYYLKSDQCDSTDRSSCREAYIQAAILTGITHTIALIFAPIFGYITDKYGRKAGLIITAINGIVASLGYAFLENPKSTWAYIFSILFGVSMIGSIITSMSLVTDQKRDHNGSISGVFGFCGGIGILIISKVGGYSADMWSGAPFFIMAIFNTVLLGATLYKGEKMDFLFNRVNTSGTYLPLIGNDGEASAI
uniref:MFS transporter n=1 Tax=Cyberlindnera americana TaxID=36016 RepID=A0A5P8N8U7_9ASCO|nr:MFS transporter [Cyberlindnera americana]